MSRDDDVTLVGENAGGRPTQARLVRGSILGRYVVLDRLGAGGMGVVFSAYDPELDRRVAIKVLHAQTDTRIEVDTRARARLTREAQSMARLSHPSVAAVYDIGTVGDRVFVAMELIDGCTLSDWLRERPRPWREIVGAFVHAGRGLAAAHEADLVHGDFKPDNVMVDEKGRIRVLDFGLARSLVTESQPISASEDARSSGAPGVTVSGGTPRYMAPEQHRGLLADPRSDQFSFCVALYEALFDQRPYAGDALPALVSNVLDGRLREMPARPRVPGRVRRALRRGLSVDPDERHPSMGALLEELERDPARAAWRWAGLAAACSIAAGVIAAASLTEREDLVCTGSAAQMEAVWDEARKRVIASAFAATAKPYADHALRKVTAELDAHAHGWVRAHEDACRATHVRKEQSMELLDRRMACLNGQLQQLDALARLLAQADAQVVARAGQAATKLPSPAACSQDRVLDDGAAPPTDPQTKAAVEALSLRRAEVSALYAAGRCEGSSAADDLADEASTVGFRPAEAEALLVAGRLQAMCGAAGAQPTLEAAARTAEAAKRTILVAEARLVLIEVAGMRAGEYDKGHWWADLAAAAIEAAGGDRELTAQLHRGRGSLLLAQGKLDPALAELERGLEALRTQDPSREDLAVALALSDIGDALAALGRNDEALRHHDQAFTIKREYFGDEHPATAAALSNRARVLWGKGELDAALAALEQALAIARSALGSDHPEVGSYLNNVGVLYEHTGQLDAAEATYVEAITNMQATLGPEHPSVPNALTNLGNVLRDQGRPHEALEKHQQALAIWERSLGREHYLFSNALVNIGNTEKDLGQLDDALGRYAEALAIRRNAYGQEHPDIAQALEHMANTHVQLGSRSDLAAAQRLYEEAVSLREKLHGDDVKTSDPLLGLGITLLRQGRPTDAIPPLERCLAIRLAGEHTPADLVWPRYHLARALWENPLHRRRSVELAREALSAIEAVGAATPEEVASIRDWVRNHG